KKQSRARCIARVNNPKNKQIFESIDLEHPITLVSSTEVILNAINDQVNADFSIITRLRDGDLELVRVTVPPESPSAGKRIVDVGLPRSSIVVAVDRVGDDLVIPNGDSILKAGDQVIVMVKKVSREEVRNALSGEKAHA
ncbi:MAG TPA: TrkA C-terminal domain-containing protein, partial [Candidatus Baltobacteraceae bacterium]|nr:TrkA C-terminal domain-containing protein [Candidatus Baltobacteraceae bacterium]